MARAAVKRRRRSTKKLRCDAGSRFHSIQSTPIGLAGHHTLCGELWTLANPQCHRARAPFVFAVVVSSFFILDSAIFGEMTDVNSAIATLSSSSINSPLHRAFSLFMQFMLVSV